MSRRAIFLVLVVYLAYGLVVIWRREARADARLVPIGLASVQSLVVLTWITLTEVSGHPDGPSFDALLTFFISGLLPLSFVQTILAWPRVRSRLKAPHTEMIMILAFVALTIGTARSLLDAPSAIKGAILALQGATVASLILVRARIMRSRTRETTTEP